MRARAPVPAGPRELLAVLPQGPPRAQRDIWRAGPDACWRRFETTLDALERRAPVTGYWLGEQLGVGDLGLFAHLHSLRTPLTTWQQARVEARPTLRAYLDRIDLATR